MVASGPSAKEAALEEVRDRCRVVAVNESWRLCPWADVLYGCDGHWWKARNGVPDFQGLKLTQDGQTCVTYRDVHKVELVPKCDQLLFDKPGLIGDGGNSGFQALNIAAQFGARRIVLVGFDMRLDLGIHWHGRHQKGMNNPHEQNMMLWRRRLNRAADTFAALGVTVLNASPVSTLTAYPIVDFKRAVG